VTEETHHQLRDVSTSRAVRRPSPRCTPARSRAGAVLHRLPRLVRGGSGGLLRLKKPAPPPRAAHSGRPWSLPPPRLRSCSPTWCWWESRSLLFGGRSSRCSRSGCGGEDHGRAALLQPRETRARSASSSSSCRRWSRRSRGGAPRRGKTCGAPRVGRWRPPRLVVCRRALRARVR